MLCRFLSFVLLAAVPGSSALLSAQSAPGLAPTPNFELYGGYSYVFSGTDNFNNNKITTSGTSGWDTSLKVPIMGAFLGIKGDVSGQYLSNQQPDFNPKQYFFLVGPQVGAHLGRSTVYAHVLVGSSHLTKEALPNLNSDSTIALAVGGGLDAGFGRHWAWRVTGDFYNTNFKTNVKNNTTQLVNSNGRVSSGPVFRF
jgi:hypothetical protein